MLQKKQFLLGLIIIGALGGYYFYAMYQAVKNETINQLNAQQMIYAKQAAKGIENYFKDIYRVLKVFAETKNIIYLDKVGENTLKTYYELDKYNIKGISRIDKSGGVIYTYPETEFIGLNIANQASFQQIKTTHQPSISDVFISNRGYQVISYHIPIFTEGVWDGSIAVFINYEMISKEFFENIKIGKSGYVRVISQNGIILYTPNTKNLGKNIIEATGKFPSTVAIAQLMMEGKEGTTSYEWDMVGEEYTGRIVKQAVFCPIKLGNTFWSIIVATPEDEIFAVMQGFIRKSIVIGSIFIVIIILLVYVQIKYWSQQREEQLKRESDKALRESEERYHIIFNQAPLGIMQFDNHGVVVEVNKKFKEIMGYPREKIIDFNLLHQLTDEAMLEAVKITLQGQRGYYEGDYFSVTANKLTSLRAVYNSLKDDNGNLIGGISTFEDISERKQAQEMLEEQIFFLQTLIDSMPFPIFYKDAMGKYLGCNTAFENFTGIPRNEMIGKNVFEVYPQDLADTYYNSDSKMFKQKEKHFYDSYYPRADGSKRNVMIQKAPFLKPDGSLGGIIGSVIDITDRKQMEEKLESLVNIRTTKLTKAIEQLQREMQERQHAEEKLIASEKKYRNIFENTIAGIAQTTPEGRFITVNPAGAALLGYASPDELINYTHDIGKQFYVDPNNRKEMIDVLSKSDKYETFETEFYRKDGKIVTLKVVYKGVRNSQGELAYLEGFVEDITEIKQAEDAIRASLNEKEVLLREIYHRTKNNMQVICSLLRLQVNYIKDERITQVLQETESRIYSMALMHEKLYQSKDLSKIDLGIYIKDLANSLMVNYLYGHEKISFHIDVMSVIVSIDTAVPCGLIINELLTNALKYAFPSGAEGNIVVSLSTTSDNEIDLVIADNGIGLPADLDFKKVNSLGLKLVFNLVENQLKGRLEVNNYPGTEYQIRFTDLGKETVGYS